MFKKLLYTLTLAISWHYLANATPQDCSGMLCDSGVCSTWYPANDQQIAWNSCINFCNGCVLGCNGKSSSNCTIYQENSKNWRCSCAQG